MPFNIVYLYTDIHLWYFFGEFFSLTTPTSSYKFVYDIGSLPDSGSLTITPQLSIKNPGDDSSDPSNFVIIPSFISYSSSSFSLIGSFYVDVDTSSIDALSQAAFKGTYTITLLLSGTSSHLYQDSTASLLFLATSPPPNHSPRYQLSIISIPLSIRCLEDHQHRSTGIRPCPSVLSLQSRLVLPRVISTIPLLCFLTGSQLSINCS